MEEVSKAKKERDGRRGQRRAMESEREVDAPYSSVMGWDCW